MRRLHDVSCMDVVVVGHLLLRVVVALQVHQVRHQRLRVYLERVQQVSLLQQMNKPDEANGRTECRIPSTSREISQL